MFPFRFQWKKLEKILLIILLLKNRVVFRMFHFEIDDS